MSVSGGGQFSCSLKSHIDTAVSSIDTCNEGEGGGIVVRLVTHVLLQCYWEIVSKGFPMTYIWICYDQLIFEALL